MDFDGDYYFGRWRERGIGVLAKVQRGQSGTVSTSVWLEQEFVVKEQV